MRTYWTRNISFLGEDLQAKNQERRNAYLISHIPIWILGLFLGFILRYSLFVYFGI